MKTSIITLIAILFTDTCLFGADSLRHGHDRSRAPDGLTASDWSGIRGAYEQKRHTIVANPDGGYLADNPGQAWVTHFDGLGFIVTPKAGTWSWGLELVGCGNRKFSSAPSRINHADNKLTCDRDDLVTEWFINDSRGLEQGWTIAKRPLPETTEIPISFDLAVRGNLRPQMSCEGKEVAFLNETGNIVLTYGGLRAWDADGKHLPARFTEARKGVTTLSVQVDDAGAKYPITVDPIAQQAYIKSSNPDVHDFFGICVAVSGDTVVVGARDEDSSATGVNGNQADNSASNSGAAYVFVRSGGIWTQQGYLKASNTGAGDNFGIDVAVSNDTIVIGAYYEASNATGVNGNEANNSAAVSGAAYVFVRSGSAWSQQAYLKASNASTYDQFGLSVGVSGDTVVVGARGEDSSATGVNGNQSDNSASSSGAAYVFMRSGTTWSQQAYLKASNTEADDLFGHSVAVSGNTVVVGAYEDSNSAGVNGNQSDNSAAVAGAAYVFERSGTTWSQQAYLKASNAGANDVFGLSVAVSGDTVVIGAFGESSSATGVNGNQADNSAPNSGAAYVFVRTGTTWSQQAYIKASNTGGEDRFGGSISVSGDTVVVGAGGEDSNAIGVNASQTDNSASSSGAAYVFVRTGTIWTQYAYLKASNSNGSDSFGNSVAVSGDTVVVGAPGESSNAVGVSGNQADNSSSSSGAVYVFTGLGKYLLTASADHGVIEGTGDYLADVTATVTATPNPGYLFTGWGGDASGTNNPLSVLMDSNKTITAYFVPDSGDPDDDGLTTYQEKVFFGTSSTASDTDGDGLSDGYEAGVGRFQIIPGAFTWSAANANAVTRGGNLASFVSAGEWDVAVAGLGPDPFALFTGLWIGLTDSVTEGVWKWTTNEPFAFNRWAPGQPDNASGADHAEISGGFGAVLGYWLDTPEAASRDGYLLEMGISTNPLVFDSDGDGLNDGQEREAGTNPFLADTDGDGLSDSVEVLFTGTSPLLSDTDGDSLSDANEDTDGDGLSNLEEVGVHHTNPGNSDTDGDGLTDLAELGRGRFQLILGSFTWAEAQADAASRGGHLAGFPTEAVYNEAMTAIGTNALNNVTGVWIGATDTVVEGSWRWSSGKLMSYNRWGPGQPDNSGGADTAEINGGFGTYPGLWVDTPGAAHRDGYIFEASFVTDPTLTDSDGDGLNDGEEKANGTPPWWGDADGDGYLDGGEVEFGGNPLSAAVVPGFKARIVAGDTGAWVEFRFLAQQGMSHAVETSMNLINWETIESNIAGQGGVMTRQYPIESGAGRYYRARKN